MSSEKEYQVNSIRHIIHRYQKADMIGVVKNSSNDFKEDELSILSSEFEEFVEKRFGKQYQEESVKAAGEYMSLSR